MIRDYLEAGLVLVPIPAGLKGPEGLAAKGWNKRANCVVAPDWAGNVGLAHAYSRTCAIDIDDLAAATRWLNERGMSLGALMDEPEAVRISSGRANRAKLIYRLPEGIEPLASKKIVEAKQNIIDFRCASSTGLTAQDVLPPSIHPDTGKPYVWEYSDDLIGDWRALPTLPSALLAIWLGLLTQQNSDSVGKEATTTLDELRTLLKDHDPDMDRDAWVEKLAIIHYETRGSAEGLALANEWSKGSKKYKGPKDVLTRWRSFHLNHANPKTAASLHVDKVASVDDFDVVEVAETTGAATAGTGAPTTQVALPAFKRDRSGKIEATIGNVLAALRSTEAFGIQIRRDTFRDEVMLSRGRECRPLKDADYVRIREEFERRSFKAIGRELMRDAVLEVADANVFDSAQAWLNGLVWDGRPRIAKFFARYFSAADTPYTTAVSMYLWTALAGRVLQPGVQADMVPVLLGPQGCGKTRGVEALVDDPSQETKIDLTERDENLSRLMRGRLVGEIAELKGLQQREAGSIKAFLSLARDSWVPKYQEFSTDYARRIVFIGTTNEDEFLADETGNRRWLPLRVGNVSVAEIRDDRAQLWAEAAMVFAVEGIDYQAAERLAIDEHQDFIISDSWEEAIAYWLRKGEGRKGRDISISEVVTGALQMDLRTCGKTQEMRIGKILRKFGYNSKVKRFGLECRRVWSPVLLQPVTAK